MENVFIIFYTSKINFLFFFKLNNLIGQLKKKKQTEF